MFINFQWATSSIKGQFSIAMSNYQRVIPIDLPILAGSIPRNHHVIPLNHMSPIESCATSGENRCQEDLLPGAFLNARCEDQALELGRSQPSKITSGAYHKTDSRSYIPSGHQTLQWKMDQHDQFTEIFLLNPPFFRCHV